MVALPGQQVPLHIFEHRYRELVADLEGEDALYDGFVIIPVIDGRLHGRGTFMRLQRVVRRYGSGELDIVTQAEQIVNVLEFDQEMDDKSYPGGIIGSNAVTYGPADDGLAKQLLDRVGTLLKALGAHRDLPAVNDQYFSFAIAIAVGLQLKEEVELIGIDAEDDRLERLLELCERNIKQAEQVLAVRRKVMMNGHFRYARGS